MAIDQIRAKSTSTMQAVVINRYGGTEVLELTSFPIPKPKLGEILVRIHAASINPLDYKIRSGQLKIFTGKKFPRILGCDFAGEIVDIGSTKTELEVGTRVFGMLNGFKGGAYAEYVSVPVEWLTQIPSKLSYEEASAIPVAARAAKKALRSFVGQTKQQSVLLNGASGGVGTFAVQLARLAGATVTAVCSRDAFNLVEQLGVYRVLDYKDTDFTKIGERYDLVFDIVGNRSFCACAPVLNPGGIYITTAPSVGGIVAQVFAQPLTGKRAEILDISPDGADLMQIASLINENYLRPIVAKVFTLAEAAAAHAYGQSQHPHGKIILQM
ncbi:NAD(P)-dependent alcohol dehydrogenase [Nostoc sphaeroides CHAB 2801]|uniref:NAD(P)-dependent alcohol dehydrogenase n=1 Tax=Nostoc sphaeroides TaxID=446679 RepID=UPI001E612538|nr:NAD(P)-dependent alcohol dehydrogenase [Nostoc sphaeroides]MCC5633253.1 NAD(P)-dependent alcohol dehydrogenase [Nostoc sphaeroides CHAB 2801]